jgi:pimeloyl-ACP methyl ester carboxylesterase
MRYDVRRRYGFHAKARKPNPYFTAAIVGTSALVGSALINGYLAKKAERENPPTGRFINIDGVHLHYVEHGEGQPLVLLHGNGSMIQDFESSGLVAAAAKSYRVIVFDRPGFGQTNRPRGTTWGPDQQADLLNKAFDHLGLSNAIVLGHSWGASVAIALGLRHPRSVGALLLVSGYYYPSFRPDFLAMSAPAIPLIGDVISSTISPFLSRLMWPALLAKIFGPSNVPAKFDGFPKEMAIRPMQIQASAAESALLVAYAASQGPRYSGLKMLVTIIAGADDRLIDPEQQSERLHADLPRSRFVRLAATGHMVHQTATEAVIDAIEETARSLRDAGLESAMNGGPSDPKV